MQANQEQKQEKAKQKADQKAKTRGRRTMAQAYGGISVVISMWMSEKRMPLMAQDKYGNWTPEAKRLRNRAKRARKASAR